MSASGQRFVALDVRKHYVVVGAVDGEQTVVLRLVGFPSTSSTNGQLLICSPQMW